jgi:hypothetical protein
MFQCLRCEGKVEWHPVWCMAVKGKEGFREVGMGGIQAGS